MGNVIWHVCIQMKDGNPRFTTLPLKPLSDQKCGRYRRFPRKLFVCVRFFIAFCSYKQEMSPQMKINSSKKQIHGYLIHT